MKKITLLLTAVLFSFLSAWSQTQPVFRIDYQIVNGSELENDNVLMTTWVNKDYFRVDNEAISSVIYITHKAEKASFALVPSTEEYVVYPEEEQPISLADYPIEFISGKERTIAGYTCKLAQLRVDYGMEDEDVTIIDIWYTEDIPNFYWGEFQLFELIEGAVLSLQIQDMHLQAKKISQEVVDNSYFEVPEDYTEMIGDDYSEDSDYQLSEDRIMYADESGNYYGLADSSGTVITEAIYSSISAFSADGVAIVTNEDSKYGAIDKSGNQLIPFVHQYLHYDEASRQFMYSVEEKYGLLASDGQIFIPAKYEFISFFEEGFATFNIDGKVGLIDINKKVVVPAIHEFFNGYNKKCFVVIEGEDYVLYDLAKNEPITRAYDLLSIHPKSELILALEDGKFGYIDEKGKAVIPFIFEYATLFVDGVASVQLEGEDPYLINTKGERMEGEVE